MTRHRYAGSCPALITGLPLAAAVEGLRVRRECGSASQGMCLKNAYEVAKVRTVGPNPFRMFLNPFSISGVPESGSALLSAASMILTEAEAFF